MSFKLAIDIMLKLDVPLASPYPFFGRSAKKRAEKKRHLGTRGRGGRRVIPCDNIIAIS